MNQPVASATALIRIRDLRYRYPGSSRDVLRIPFLDITGRGLIAITGPSGVGKSTLIELLAGTLNEPYGGSVEILGVEWKQLTRDADRQRHLRKIGLIPQDYGLLTDRTARQMLQQDLADSGVHRDQREQRLSWALEQVGLPEFSDRRLSTLSGGQLQRVAIARMLARDVQLVIADEPTANLDRELTAATVAIFRNLASRVPVVLITHDPQVAEACDRTIVLQSTVPDRQAAVPAAVSSRRPGRWPAVALALLLAGGVAFGVIKLTGDHHPSRGASSRAKPADTAAAGFPALSTGAAARPPSEAATASPAPGTIGGALTSPDGVVIAFFKAINHRDWPRVWQLGGKNLGAPYAQMVQGFAKTGHDDVTITSTDGNSVSVLLIAVQTSGQAQFYQGAYLVANKAIVQGRQSLRATGPIEPAIFSSFAGTWQGHDRGLTISPGGLGVLRFRVFQYCSINPAPPCDSVSGNEIYPGGVTAFQLTRQSGNQAQGYIEDGSIPGTTGPITITFQPSADSLVMTTSSQSHGVTYCGQHAPAGLCGA